MQETSKGLDRQMEFLSSDGSLRLTLDADQIVPHDPGDGCPCVVTLLDEDGEELGDGTFRCVQQEGEIWGDRECYTLSAFQNRVLELWWEEVLAFEDAWFTIRVNECLATVTSPRFRKELLELATRYPLPSED